jgi:hypothetical protein
MRSRVAGRAVAIVDDVANTGSATRATYSELGAAGSRPVAIATLLTLGTAVPKFARERGLMHTSLATLPNRSGNPRHALCARRARHWTTSRRARSPADLAAYATTALAYRLPAVVWAVGVNGSAHDKRSGG